MIYESLCFCVKLSIFVGNLLAVDNHKDLLFNIAKRSFSINYFRLNIGVSTDCMHTHILRYFFKMRGTILISQ